ncbi:PLP-dependent aminotransferase family protein [Leekyejoonella antrihumi]|uniref:PLP-dependent aminotransferase family protein n=1 Tax=Leekyejoonella antrihumi TaxID=1660198 RepID=A0A563DUJ0_9MICO|nr:PLP-dependent aminotransferase family protein [Leekyejoonella antrihumi]TWP33582.1 PLP-dependent aminotransferase family protein [Leekyejoonella antrihumi]
MVTRVSAARLTGLLGSRDDGRPAYQWLADEVIGLVGDGRLLHGARLPSERDLVSALGLSRTTVTRAYGQIRERGFAEARHGSGTLVQVPGGVVRGGGEPLPHNLDLAPEDTVADLRSASPPAPTGLTAAYAEGLARLPSLTGGMGYFPFGLPELQEVIADRYTERGAPTTPDQIVVTTGALSALVAVLHGLLRIGDRVAIETPSYPNSLEMMRDSRMRMIPAPISSDGADLEGVEQALRHGPRAMLALPDFHNPTGVYLDDEERARLAHLWQQYDVLGIVDETNAEMWLDVPAPALPMAAHSPRCITVGSAAKTYWGGLRVGWARVPVPMVQAVRHARLCLDLGAAVLEQLVLVELMRVNGSLCENSRSTLRESRQVMLGLQAELPDWQVVCPRGGLGLWWRLPRPRSSALVAAAQRRGVLLASGSSFAVEGRGLETYVRTPYALYADRLRPTVPLIAEAWREVAGE